MQMHRNFTTPFGIDLSTLLAFARGTYQHDLVIGLESWSGSTLRDNGRTSHRNYTKSRTALADRLRSAGYSYAIYKES